MELTKLKDFKLKEKSSIIKIAETIAGLEGKDRLNYIKQNEIPRFITDIANNIWFPEYYMPQLDKKLDKKYSDIENKVFKKTGKMLNIADIRNGYYIQGENGDAIIEVIIAGGYNIQRLHYRVLVR